MNRHCAWCPGLLVLLLGMERGPGASSTRSIVGHGEGHITRQPALNDACMPVASPGPKECNKAMRRR
jgi:hypothetical protein